MQSSNIRVRLLRNVNVDASTLENAFAVPVKHVAQTVHVPGLGPAEKVIAEFDMSKVYEISLAPESESQLNPLPSGLSKKMASARQNARIASLIANGEANAAKRKLIAAYVRDGIFEIVTEDVAA